MAKRTKKNPLAATVGAAVVASSMSASAAVHTAENPFAATDLNTGYQLASAHAEGKCGEGKCGDKKGEGRCGEDKAGEKKASEGKCGEGKCGGDKAAADKGAEGKCGEGKCGGKA